MKKINNITTTYVRMVCGWIDEINKGEMDLEIGRECILLENDEIFNQLLDEFNIEFEDEKPLTIYLSSIGNIIFENLTK
jgi:hypothetical protein